VAMGNHNFAKEKGIINTKVDIVIKLFYKN